MPIFVVLERIVQAKTEAAANREVTAGGDIGCTCGISAPAPVVNAISESGLIFGRRVMRAEYSPNTKSAPAKLMSPALTRIAASAARSATEAGRAVLEGPAAAQARRVPCVCAARCCVHACRGFRGPVHPTAALAVRSEHEEREAGKGTGGGARESKVGVQGNGQGRRRFNFQRGVQKSM